MKYIFLHQASNTLSHSLLSSIQWMEQYCGISPSSRQGRLVYMLIMLLLPLAPILALISQNILLLTDTIQQKTDLQEADRSVLESDQTARLIRDWS